MRQTFDPRSLKCLPQYAEPIVKVWNCSVLQGSMYISFDAFWKSIKPSGSSGGHSPSKMRAWYTFQHIFMQDCGTWPSGWKFFYVETILQTTGVVLGAAGNRLTKTRQRKGPRKTGLLHEPLGRASGPHLCMPKSLFAIPMPVYRVSLYSDLLLSNIKILLSVVQNTTLTSV